LLAGGELAEHGPHRSLCAPAARRVGNAETVGDESFEGGLLEYPITTRPAQWDGPRLCRMCWFPAIMLRLNLARQKAKTSPGTDAPIYGRRAKEGL